MIKASFFETNGRLKGFSVSGHANFADKGGDIVCAGVSSAVQMCVNAVTEILKEPADVSVEENKISLTLKNAGGPGEEFIEALRLQIICLAEDYENTIELYVVKGKG